MSDSNDIIKIIKHKKYNSKKEMINDIIRLLHYDNKVNHIYNKKEICIDVLYKYFHNNITKEDEEYITIKINYYEEKKVRCKAKEAKCRESC